MRHAGRRLGVRAALISACVLAGLIMLAFLLGAATVALTERYGLLQALGIMAGAAFLLLLLLLGILAIEARRERRIAARRAALDSRLLRSAAISAAVPQVARLPSRAGLGLGLVALGALLVLARRGDDEGED